MIIATFGQAFVGNFIFEKKGENTLSPPPLQFPFKTVIIPLKLTQINLQNPFLLHFLPIPLSTLSTVSSKLCMH